jgi:hypothetical protein
MSEIPLASQEMCRMTQGRNYPLIDESSGRPYPVFPSAPVSHRDRYFERTTRVSISVVGMIGPGHEIKHVIPKRN